jgi:hypothetical protein
MVSVVVNVTGKRVALPVEMSDAELREYFSQPFQSHQEYVSQLKGLTKRFPEEMEHTDKKGRTVLEIIQAGAAFRHFGYLQNGSLFRTLADGMAIKEGTSANEAENRSIKGWMECVYQQHRDRLDSLSSLYGLYKMLGNAYRNTDRRSVLTMTERRSVVLMSGLIAKGVMDSGVAGGAEAVAVQQIGPLCRSELYRPVVKVSDELKASHVSSLRKHRAAHHAQLKLDYQANKSRLKRVSGKTSLTSSSITVKRSRKHVVRKNSQCVHDRISASLAASSSSQPVPAV